MQSLARRKRCNAQPRLHTRDARFGEAFSKERGEQLTSYLK